MSLILDHVNHIYGEDTNLAVAALVDINLVIPDGQFIGLIGHTGSGKSTLVQHLNGLLKPTSGAIYFNGQDTIWWKEPAHTNSSNGTKGICREGAYR